MNLLGLSRSYHEFTICFAVSLSIYYLVHELTMNKLSVSWFHYRFREYTMISHSISQTYFGFTIFLRIYYELPIFFAFNSLSFYANSLSVWGIHYEFTWSFAKLPWIHCLIRDSTINWLCVPGIHYLLRLYKMNWLFISRIFYEFNINFSNSLWIELVFRKFTENLLS